MVLAISLILITCGLTMPVLVIDQAKTTRRMEWLLAIIATGGLIASATSVVSLGIRMPFAEIMLASGLLCWWVNLLSSTASEFDATRMSIVGLLGVTATASSAAVLIVGAVLLIVIRSTQRINDGTIRHEIAWHDFADLIVAGLLTIAGLITISMATGTVQLIGTALLLTGIGASIGWFPFPQVSAPTRRPLESTAMETWVPCLIVSCFLFRATAVFSLSTAETFLFVVAGLFTMLISSMRLFTERQLVPRLRLLALITLSQSILVLGILGWENSSPQRVWLASSNLPTAMPMFVAILLVDTIAFLLLLIGVRFLTDESDGLIPEDLLHGAMARSPWGTGLVAVSLISLTGLVPWLGSSVRFQFIAALFLPHQISTLTSLSESQPGMAELVIVYTSLLAITSVAHVLFIQRLTIGDAFRVRTSIPSGQFRLLTGGMLVLFLMFNFAGFALIHTWLGIEQRHEKLPRSVEMESNQHQLTDFAEKSLTHFEIHRR